MTQFILNRKARIKCSPLLSILALLIIFASPSFSQPIKDVNVSLKITDKQIEFQTNSFTAGQSRQMKSGTKALFYSLLSTAIPVGIGAVVDGDAGAMMMALGVSAGPSVGILYSKDIDRAATGMGVRTSGVGIAAIGGLFHVLESLSGDDDGLSVGNVMITGGLSLTGASLLYDIFIESPKAARKYNDRIEREKIEINPWVNPSIGIGGMSLKVQF